MLELFYSFRAAALQLLVDILPDSPITQAWLETGLEDTSIALGLRWLNWLVDINAMIIILDMWLIAVGVYYMARYGISIFGGLKNLAVNVFTTLFE